MGFPGEVQEFEDVTGATCLMVQAHLAQCPTCCLQHKDDRYRITPLVSSCHTIRSFESCCQERILAYELLCHDRLMKQILDDPRTEAPFADLYAAHQGGLLLSDSSGQFYRFNGNRWIRQHDVEVQKDMQPWLRFVLERFHNLLDLEQSCLSPPGTRKNDVSKEINGVRGQVEKAQNFVNSETKIGLLTSTVKREVYKAGLEDIMDK